MPRKKGKAGYEKQKVSFRNLNCLQKRKREKITTLAV